MSSSEKQLGIVKDVVLPVDVCTRYDVYFTDRRVAIICMGRADRFESEASGPVSLMPAVFGVPPPTASYVEKAKSKPSIDEEVKDWSLDDLLKLSKKSCFYTIKEIEKVELVWGKTLKFVILSKDCESKFAPDEKQFEQLFETIPTIKGLKDKLWIAGKWGTLFGESPAAATCKFCGSTNEPDAVYCQSCGKKIEQEPASVPPSELTCSLCGTKNTAQAQFCKQCGTPIHMVTE